MDQPHGVSPGQPGASNRPPLAAEATAQAATSPPAPNRCRTPATSNPTAANTSPTGDPAGPGGTTSIPVANPARVKNTPTTPARAPIRRSQPRTVDPGTPTRSATYRHPPPDTTFITNASMITWAEYMRRSRHNTGINVCVDRQPAHRVRRGRTHQPPPPATRTSRHRAEPHPTNRAEHPGHLNRPAARSLSTTEPVPDTVNTVVPPSATARPSHGQVSSRTCRGRAVAQQVVCTLMMQTNHRNTHPHHLQDQ